MHVLLTNTYSHQNKGDAGIVQGILSSLWEIDETIHVTLVSLDAEADRAFYTDPRVEVIEAPFPVPADGTGKAAQVGHWLGQALWRFPASMVRASNGGQPPSEEARAFVETARSCELALACGGGYLHDSFPMGMYVHLGQLWLAQRAGLPVYLLPQSIGPASGLHRPALASGLARADHVYVREPVSQRYVQGLNVDTPLTLAPDAAFALTGERTAQVSETADAMGDLDRPTVGFTVRQWHFPGAEHPDTLYERYLTSYGELVEHREDVNFVFVPQVTGPGADDDRIALDAMKETMGWATQPENLSSVPENLTPSELIALIAQMDAFAGTRMHSNIFALLGRVPTLAVSYLPKTNGIMRMLGLEDWVIDIDEVTPGRLAAALERLLQAKAGYRRRLNDRMPAIEEQARLPIRRILKDEVHLVAASS